MLQQLEPRCLLAGIENGDQLAVASGEWVDVSGQAFQDLNGNEVRDYHSSSGVLGTSIYSDQLSSDWLAQSIAASVDLENGEDSSAGDQSIRVDVSGSGNRGVQFSYIAGNGLPIGNLDALRVFVKSTGTSTKLRVRMVGTNGATSVGNISISSADWEPVTVNLASFASIGDVKTIQFLFTNPSVPYTVRMDEVAWLGGETAADEQPITGTTNWGVNLFTHDDASADAAFTNTARTFRRWGQLNAPWLDDPGLSYSDQGNPLSPAASVFFLQGYEPGIYQLRYEGTATVAFKMGAGQQGSIGYVPGSLRVEGNETVAEVEITNPGVLMEFRLEAVNPNDPIRNLQLLAPGYHGSSPATYRAEFIERLRPFSTLRFMDYIQTNYSDVTDWSERRLPTDTIQTNQQLSSEAGGVAWELLIDMANAAQADAWINIPHQVDANYISELATLWRDNLDPNLKLIVEFSNEIWNPLFSQFFELNNADYAGIVGPKLTEIRQTFDSVWGAEKSRVEVVLAGQSGNTIYINNAIGAIEQFVDQNPNDDYDEVSDVISAVAIAVYANPEFGLTYSNLNDALTRSLDMTDERIFVSRLRDIADEHGVKMYGYEGGQHLRSSQTSYDDLVSLAQRDARMGDILRAINDVWLEHDGDLFMHYTFTGGSAASSEWGLLNSSDEPGSVRWDAAMSMLSPAGDVNIDGSTDFADFLVIQNYFGQQDLWWEQGDLTADRFVDGEDLEAFWLAVDVNSLSVSERNTIESFAAAQNVTLPNETLTLSAGVAELWEDATALAPNADVATPLTITRSGSLAQPIEVRLEIDDSTELKLERSTVTIPAGQASATVLLFAVNDGIIDATQRIKVTVAGSGYAPDALDVQVRDTGDATHELTLAGATVFLDANGNQTWDPGEPTTQTGANGRFTFKHVPAGSYQLEVIAQAGQQPGAGTLDPLSVATSTAHGAVALESSIGLDGAFQFDGSQSHIDYTLDDRLALGSTSIRSVSLWFYSLDTAHRQVIYEEGDASTGLNIYLEDGQLFAGGWDLRRKFGDADWTGSWVATNVTPNQWHHVTLVLDGGEQITADTVIGYLNGSEFGRTSGTQLRDRNNIAALGGANSETRYQSLPNVSDTTNSLIGYADELQLFERSLSPAEIVALADQSLVAPAVSTDPVAFLSARDGVAAEPGSDGEFLITLTNPSSTDTTISYSVTGSAIGGVDYETLAGSVTIPALQTSASIEVKTINDNLVEANETVAVSLQTITDGGSNVSIGGRSSATVDLLDDDDAVVLVSGTSDAAEPTTDGVFVITLSKPSDQDTTIGYTVTGGATPGTDYVSLPGTVTIPAGSVSATLDVVTINDTHLEPNEAVTVSLKTLDAGGRNVSLGTNTGSIIIADDDTATLSLVAGDGTASEFDPSASFDLQLSHPSATETVVQLSLGGSATPGSDFETFPLIVAIPAFSQSVTVDVTAIADTEFENEETLTVSLANVSSGDKDISIDSQQASTSITFAADITTLELLPVDLVAAEPANHAQLSLSSNGLVAVDTTVAYAVTGTAISGDDYQVLSGQATIPANQMSTLIDIVVIDDLILESAKTLTLTLTSIVSGPLGAEIGATAEQTVTLTDNDSASLNVFATPGAEPGGAGFDGEFEFQLSQPSDTATSVSYNVSGSAIANADFGALAGTVTIPANVTSVSVPFQVFDDVTIEPNETIIVTLVPSTLVGNTNISIGTGAATATITDNDAGTVRIDAENAVVSEDVGSARFVVSLSELSSTPTELSYTVGGNSSSGNDFVPLTGVVTIPANTTSADIEVSIVDDALVEATESLTIELTQIVAGDPQLTIDPSANSDSVTLEDNDSGLVQLAATHAAAIEGGEQGTFTVSLTQAASSDTVLHYLITNATATEGEDFAPLSGQVTILAGQASAAIRIEAIDNEIVESDETVTVRITEIASGDDDLAIDTNTDEATVTLVDDDAAAISVQAFVANASEPNTDGEFRISLSKASDTDTVIGFSSSGNATINSDYLPLTNSVTIPAFSTTVDVPVVVVNDDVLEPTEQVVLTLDTAPSSGNPNVSVGVNSSAIVNILDDDETNLHVEVSNQAAEPSTDGRFTITLEQESSTDTVVGYTVGGTATPGVDYEALSGSVVIPAGSTTATIDVNVIDSDTVEPSETVTVALNNSLTSGDADITINTAVQTLTITDDDAATVGIAVGNNAIEDTMDGRFVVSLSQPSSIDTTVLYDVTGSATSGTDFVGLSGTVTIPANTLSVNIDVAAIVDNLLEDSEQVTITLEQVSFGNGNVSISPGGAQATLDIVDDDSAVLSAVTTISTASEAGVNGRFTVSVDNPSDRDTVVEYQLGGSALAIEDYTPVTGEVRILAGQSSATVNLLIVDDNVLEGSESVTLQLLPTLLEGHASVSVDTSPTSPITILDDDIATLTLNAPVSSISEPQSVGSTPLAGQFSVSLDHPSSTATVINYTVTGDATPDVDYMALSGSITIPAGSTLETIDVVPLFDGIAEPVETVELQLAATVASGDPDITVNTTPRAVAISDAPVVVVNVEAVTAQVAESASSGEFLFTLSEATDVDTEIGFVVSGTASSGDDFVFAQSSITIDAGQVSAPLVLPLIDDDIVESIETITITIDDQNVAGVPSLVANTIPATLEIVDSDTSAANIVASIGSAAEPTSLGQFKINLSAPSSSDTVFAYTVSGNATAGQDYSSLPGTVTVPAGQTSATIDLQVLDDAQLESTELVTVTLLPTIVEGSPRVTSDGSIATVTIEDDDSGTISIAATTSEAHEPDVNGVFTVTLSAPSDSATIVTYQVTGSATPGVDYTALSGTITIPAQATTKTILVPVLDNSLVESQETVTLTLQSIDAGHPNLSLAAVTDTVTISDDDTAELQVSVGNSAAEPATNGRFVLTLTEAADTDTVIAYTVGGDATSGIDYTQLSGTVTIPAESTSVEIEIAVLDDSLVEPRETVTLTLDPTLTAGDPDIVIQTTTVGTWVTDNDAATVELSATQTAVDEDSGNAQFEVTLSQQSSTETVLAYEVLGTAIAGQDFTELSGTVTVPAFASSATIDLTIIDDSVVEGLEHVTLQLTQILAGDENISIAADSGPVSIDIVDTDAATVSLFADAASYTEADASGSFRVLLSQPSSTATQVSYTVAGTSTAGTDYSAMSGTVTVPAGQLAAPIPFSIFDDATLEAQETIVVELASILTGDVDLSLHPTNTESTITIGDDDFAVIEVLATHSVASEPATSGQFTISLSQPSDTATSISLGVTGSATEGEDFVALPTTITIDANQLAKTISVPILDDSILEADETLTLTVLAIDSGDPELTIGPSDSATVTLVDDDTATATLQASVSTASEDGAVGQFTVSLSHVSATDTVIGYTLGGTATVDVDYVATPNTVTILAGETSATFAVAPNDDGTVEATETIVATLASVLVSGDEDITVNTSERTVSLIDNDVATVSIQAASDADEAGTAGQFLIELSQPSDTDTRVALSVTGNATAGDDYTSLESTVLIPANTLSATVSVAPLVDDLVELDETVTVSLVGITQGNSSIALGAASTATVVLVDDDVAEVTATALLGATAEGGAPGQITFELSKLSDQATTVSYLVSGDATAGQDYEGLSGQVTIPAMHSSVQLPVTILDDEVVEDDESVTVTLNSITAGHTSNISIGPDAAATIEIDDNDSATASITASAAFASEPAAPGAASTNGQFTVSLDAASDRVTTIGYVVSGTAAASDFEPLSGSVDIAALSMSATIDLVALYDSLLEANETVTLTLVSPIAAGDEDIAVDSNPATVTITDDSVVTLSVQAITPSLIEDATNAQFKVVLSEASATDTTIDYSLAGTAMPNVDFDGPTTGTITFPANTTTATVSVPVREDTVVEQAETIVMTLASSISSGNSNIDVQVSPATVTVLDDDTATLTLTKLADASEPSTNGRFQLSLDRPSSTTTTIGYNVTGTATPGQDYVALSGTASIPAGETSVDVIVTIINNSVVEVNETVIVTLNPSISSGDADISVQAGTETVTISDDDAATATIVAINNATESGSSGGNMDGQFRVSLSAASSTATVLAYDIDGTAVAGEDFQALSGLVTIPAGSTSADIVIAVVDDSRLELQEDVTLRLTGVSEGSPAISIDPTPALVTIDDLDAAIVSVEATTANAYENGEDGAFTISLSHPSDQITEVGYTVAGDAIADSDYTLLSGIATFAPGEMQFTIPVSVIDDDLLEPTELVTVLLVEPINSGDVDITVDTTAATVAVIDDELATASIVAETAAASEGGIAGRFTVSLSSLSSMDTTFDLLVAGTAMSDVDFTPIPTQVTIPAYTSGVSFDLLPLQDDLVEANETVSVALISPPTSGVTGIQVNSSPAIVTISDDDTAVVTIAAGNNAYENGSPGSFVVSLSQRSATATVVNLNIAGEAANGTDYELLPATVTIPANTLSASIPVIAIDDEVNEGDESVSVSLVGLANADENITLSLGNESATLPVVDDDAVTVSVTAVTPVVDEGIGTASFRFELSGVSDQATEFTYQISGTSEASNDWSGLTGTLSIPAQQTSREVVVSITDDSLLETSETLRITLDTLVVGTTLTSLSPDPATLTITDNDTAILSVTPAASPISESANAEWNVTLSQPSAVDTEIDFVLDGTATASDDFIPPETTSVVILAGQTTARVSIAIVDDVLLESTEQLSLGLVSGTLVGASAIVVDETVSPIDISDNDFANATIQVTNEGTEGSATGELTVTLDHPSDTATVIGLLVSGLAEEGVDFETLPEFIEVPAGQTSATLAVAITDDDILESTETIVVTLVAPISAGDPQISVTTTPATMSVFDNDVATLQVTPSGSASEPGQDGSFEITLSAASSSATTVSYTVTGTATAGQDYVALSGTATLEAGSTTLSLPVSVLSDSVVEETETVIVTLSSPLGSGDADIVVDTTPASVQIIDDSASSVTISTDLLEIPETSGVATLTFTMTNPSSTPTTVSYSVTGDASVGSDYTGLNGSIVVPANVVSVTETLTALHDTVVENSETVTVTLTSTDNAAVSVNGVPLSISILDDDNTDPTLAPLTFAIPETAVGGQLVGTIVASDPDPDETLSYSIAGGTGSSLFDIGTSSGMISVASGVSFDASATSNYQLDIEVEDSRGGTAQAVVTIVIDSVVQDGPNFFTDVISDVSSANWRTVTLPTTYSSMVVLATPSYEASSPPMVTRIRNASGNQFEIKLGRADGQSNEVFADVHFTVVEEGVYTTAEHGIKMEAVKYTSTLTDGKGSWNGEQITGSLINSYSQPVVIGQVMTSNDPHWSVFWTRGTASGNPPSSTSVFIGKHVGESSDRSLVAEDIGFVVIELGNGQVGDFEYSARVGSDIVDGFPQGGGVYSVSGVSNLLSAVASINGLDGGDGAWPVLVGADTFTASTLQFVADEDQESDSERGHTTEQMGYLILGTHVPPSEVSVSSNVSTIAEASGAATLTFELSEPSSTPTTVYYSVTGSATSGEDYVSLSGSITIPASVVSVTEQLTALDDAVVELSETVTVTLTGTDSPAVTVDSQPVTISILDDDNTDPTLNAATFAILETAVGNDVVGTVVATDPDPNETFSYTIVGGTGSSLFEIGTTSGIITVALDASFDASIADSYELDVQVDDSRGGTAQATVTINIDVVDPNEDSPKFFTGVSANVSSTNWTTITLPTTYDSMVVIATPSYNASSPPMVTRIRNATGNQFELRLARADGQSGEVFADVHYTVVEEGIYTTAEHGIEMEAVKFTSTLTDGTNSWNGEQVVGSLTNSYSTPVVIGQVMTSNDPQWAVFWSRGSARENPPSSSSIIIGKHVGASSDRSLVAEEIGYLVIEQGSGAVGDFEYTAQLGSDIIDGFPQNGGVYSFTGVSVPISAVGSLNGLDGTDGTWPVIVGDDGLTDSTLYLVADEDQEADSERGHTDEQIGYLVLGSLNNVAPTATNDTYFTSQDESLDVSVSLGVLSNDFDANPNDTLTASLVTDVAHGDLVLQFDGSFVYVPDSGFVGTDQFTYDVTDGDLTSTATVWIDVTEASQTPLVNGVVTATTETWTTVALPQSFSSMVVVTTIQNDAASPSMVARVKEATGNTFQIRLVRTDGGGGAFSQPVHFFVVEEGVYTVAEHGVKMEAVRFDSTVTDRKSSWLGEDQLPSLSNAYDAPVVVGQVMTSNDPHWSVFWSRGSAQAQPVAADKIFVGKHVGESPTTSLATETIGYVVFESGAGTIGNIPFEASVGSDAILGITNGGGSYSLSYVTNPDVAIGSVTGMDGGDGGWGVLFGDDAISATSIKWAVDEDQAADSERAHVDEQLAYVVFGASAVQAVPATARSGSVSQANLGEPKDLYLKDPVLAEATKQVRARGRQATVAVESYNAAASAASVQSAEADNDLAKQLTSQSTVTSSVSNGKQVDAIPERDRVALISFGSSKASIAATDYTSGQLPVRHANRPMIRLATDWESKQIEHKRKESQIAAVLQDDWSPLPDELTNSPESPIDQLASNEHPFLQTFTSQLTAKTARLHYYEQLGSDPNGALTHSLSDAVLAGHDEARQQRRAPRR